MFVARLGQNRLLQNFIKKPYFLTSFKEFNTKRIKNSNDSPNKIKILDFKKSLGLKNGMVNDSTEWITIYRFPMIVPVRIFSRAKVHFTIFSALTIPISINLYIQNSANLSAIAFSTSMLLFSTIVLYGFGTLFRRLIGSIYVTEDLKRVRISHLTFFGNRQESYFLTENILPLSDSNSNMNEKLIRVSFFDDSTQKLSPNSFFIVLKGGGIVDKDKFEKVFGSF